MKYCIAKWLKEFRGMTIDPEEFSIVAFVKTDRTGVRHCVLRRKGRNEYINMYVPALAVKETQTGPDVIEDCNSFEEAIDKLRKRNFRT